GVAEVSGGNGLSGGSVTLSGGDASSAAGSAGNINLEPGDAPVAAGGSQGGSVFLRVGAGDVPGRIQALGGAVAEFPNLEALKAISYAGDDDLGNITGVTAINFALGQRAHVVLTG